MGKPKIRFKEFTEDWEQRKAADIAEYSKGNGYSKSDLTEIGTPIILYGRLYTKYQFVINEVDTFAVPKKGAVYSEGNEVIVPASGETAGDIARASAVEKSGVLLGGDLNILRPFDFINPLFLALAISNGGPQKELAKRAQGKSVVHIHNSDIQELSISYPTRTEQDKIIAVFRNLDNLITLHQRKCNETKKLKKYMLQKMFPQNGMKVPEIRFEGFTGDWEQRKVEDIMSCITDYVAAGSFADIRENVTYLNENGYAQLVRTVDLKKKFTNDDFVFVDENAFKYLWRVNLNEACIVLPNIGANIGEVYYVEPSELPEKNNVLGPNAILLRTNEDKYFIFILLSSNVFQKQLFENVGSSGQPKFNKTELKSIAVSMPDINEQKKIGSYFKSLDHLITLHQRKCDELVKIKKYMLQNMFA